MASHGVGGAMRWAVGKNVVVWGDESGPATAIWGHNPHHESSYGPFDSGNGFDWFITNPRGGPFRIVNKTEALERLREFGTDMKTILTLDGEIAEWQEAPRVPQKERLQVVTQLPGFGKLDRVALVAAASREHMLIVGKPGRAKSLWTRRVFSHFEGNLFDKELSKWSDETTLFGPPNLKELRESGKVEYFRAGFADAEWVSIQEFFDASDVLLRTMLGGLQERTLYLGQVPMPIPLRSCFATANYSRVNEVTEAVVDRFAFTVPVPELTPAERGGLYDLSQRFEEAYEPAERILLPELDALGEDARDVTLRGEVRDLLLEWASGAELTPRRERKIAKVLRVSAAIGGRAEVSVADAELLEFLTPLGTKQNTAADVVQKVKELVEQESIARYEARQVEDMLKGAEALGKAQMEARYRVLQGFRTETPLGKEKKREAVERLAGWIGGKE